MLHKILTAGPSAFNITTILSQAAQLSNQGKEAEAWLCANIVSYMFILAGKKHGQLLCFLYVSCD